MDRGDLPAGTYHVTTRSAGPMTIFDDDIECTYFCNLLARAVKSASWQVRAFCIMPTHYHLLVDVLDNALQRVMQRVNWSYARWFNTRHGRKGHLFGERYYSGPILTDGHMLSTMRYIARNPVKAGLCANPVDWRWSSYRGCIDLEKPFPFVAAAPLRAYFGADRELATVLIRQFIELD
jgi:putative transposase